MKLDNILFSIVFCFLLLSCENRVSMKTVINPDGSCYRELEKSGVGGEFFMKDSVSSRNPFPVEIDSTWSLSWKIEGHEWRTDFPVSEHTFDSILEISKDLDEYVDSIPLSVRIRRDFFSVDEMSNEYKIRNNHPWKDVKIDYKLSKKFRWFYTFYEYKETYFKSDFKFDYPIEDFMSKDEYLFWFIGEPNLTTGLSGMEAREYLGQIENKYNKWFAKNKWSSEYDHVINNYNKITKGIVSKEKLISLKDTIFDKEVASNVDFDLTEVLNKYFKTKAFSLMELDGTYDFENEYAFLSATSFEYNLILPGKIIKSNANSQDENGKIWNLTAYRFLVNDYNIEASSRTTNVWAFIVTGLIILLALGGLFYKKK